MKAPILVVGAGPVGLMLAAELHRHGVKCRLIERLAAPSNHCKALGITPRTLEVWDDLGIAQQALDAGLPLKGLLSAANGDFENVEVAGSAIPEGAYGFLTLAQYEVERILAGHLQSVGGEVEREVEITSLEQQADAVRVQLKHATGREETAEFQYVVGCDGGRSFVRHTLSLKFEGSHYEQVFMLADVELDAKFERGYGYKVARLDGEKLLGAAAFIPVPGKGNRYRLSGGAPPEMVPAELTSADAAARGLSELGPTLAQVQDVIDWLCGPGITASDMRWSAFYRISHRIVPRYSVGRVFLAGDAAHLHPPLGGQGLNTGVQDAYNLGWKMARVVRVLSPESLLESYDAERRPIGESLVERTSARMNRVLSGQVDEREPVRDDSQLFINYRESLVTDISSEASGTGIQPGDRAPDVTGLRRTHTRHDLRLFDLTRGTHHTLLFYTPHSAAADDCRDFAQQSAAVRNKLNSPLHVYCILHPDCDGVPPEVLPTLIDTHNEFARLYQPLRGSSYLIRPDGYLTQLAATPFAASSP